MHATTSQQKRQPRRRGGQEQRFRHDPLRREQRNPGGKELAAHRRIDRHNHPARFVYREDQHERVDTWSHAEQRVVAALQSRRCESCRDSTHLFDQCLSGYAPAARLGDGVRLRRLARTHGKALHVAGAPVAHGSSRRSSRAYAGSRTPVAARRRTMRR